MQYIFSITANSEFGEKSEKRYAKLFRDFSPNSRKIKVEKFNETSMMLHYENKKKLSPQTVALNFESYVRRVDKNLSSTLYECGEYAEVIR